MSFSDEQCYVVIDPDTGEEEYSCEEDIPEASQSAPYPTPAPNLPEEPPSTSGPVSPSDDLDGSVTDRATGETDATSPFNLSNSENAGSPFSFFDDSVAPEPYYLIDSHSLDITSPLTDLALMQYDASEYYDTGTAWLALLTGKDKLKDLIIGDNEEFYWGARGAIAGGSIGLVLGISFAPPATPALVDEMGEAGYLVGTAAREVYEKLWDDPLTRASGLNSLLHQLATDSNQLPNPTPGPRPSMPDMGVDGSLKLK
jgi:hypothetical protein